MENEKQLFGVLKQQVELGFARNGRVYGFLRSEELSDVEKTLRKEGLVFYDYDIDRDFFDPHWFYTVSEKGLRFYDKMKGEAK